MKCEKMRYKHQNKALTLTSLCEKSVEGDSYYDG